MQGPAQDHAAAFSTRLVETNLASRDAPLFVGRDLRDSSEAIAAQVAAGVAAVGLEPISLGVLPSPALAHHAMRRNAAIIMVTGSHIPADQNGLKFFRPDGEIDKEDEAAISRLATQSPSPVMADEGDTARDAYRLRYAHLFPGQPLAGMKIGLYEHSSVVRELLADLLQQFGAAVTLLGRSDVFVAVDTESITPSVGAQFPVWAKKYGLDEIGSTDGDADRPLVIDENGQQVRPDVLGLVCARYVGASAVVTPATSNTGISPQLGFNVVRTCVESPFVIAAMTAAVGEGRAAVVGFEANAGFLTGSALPVNGANLDALPTRDCILPILARLVTARKEGKRLSTLVASLDLPRSASDRLEHFPYEQSAAFMEWLRADLGQLATAAKRFGRMTGSADIDGVQIFFDDGSAVHFRPREMRPRCAAMPRLEPSIRPERWSGPA